MKIIPVLIINLRGSHAEMSDLHATTILYIYMDFRNIMFRGGPFNGVDFHALSPIISF